MSSSPPPAQRVPLGLKVTLYHWEKSLRRGRETNLHSAAGSASPGATPHLLIAMVMRVKHMHVSNPIFLQIYSLCTISFQQIYDIKNIPGRSLAVALCCSDCTDI